MKKRADWPAFPVNFYKPGLLLRHRFNAGVQARLVAASRVLVDHTFLHALVDHRNGSVIGALDGIFLALGQGGPKRAEGAAQARFVGPVARGLGLSLPGALQRRVVISHALLESLRGKSFRGNYDFTGSSGTRQMRTSAEVSCSFLHPFHLRVV